MSENDARRMNLLIIENVRQSLTVCLCAFDDPMKRRMDGEEVKRLRRFTINREHDV